MPTYPLVKFVDGVSGATRLDLNTAPWKVRPGFDPGVPALEGTKYGPRQLTVPLQLVGTKAVTAPQLSLLARELHRRDNWLLHQLSAASDPVWFRTERGAPGDQGFDNVYDDDTKSDIWNIDLSLDAEGLAYGVQVVLGAVTINNDPAAGTNPQSYTLPAILGDAPAPLSIEASYTGTVVNNAGPTLLLSRHSNTGANARRLEQFDSTWTVSSDTTLQANDPLMSGAGSNYLRTTFTGDPTMADRAIKTLAAVPEGRYKVLVRVRKTVAAGVFDLRFRVNTVGSSPVDGPVVRFAATPGTPADLGPVVLDLGYLSVPWAGALKPGVVSASPDVEVEAQRVSGTGSLDWDYLLLVPVDVPDVPAADTLTTNFNSETSGVAFVVGWNADDDEVYGTRAGLAFGPHLNAGRFPTVCPGWNNHLVFLRHVGTVARLETGSVPDDKLTDTTSLTFSYYPRYSLLGSA